MSYRLKMAFSYFYALFKSIFGLINSILNWFWGNNDPDPSLYNYRRRNSNHGKKLFDTKYEMVNDLEQNDNSEDDESEVDSVDGDLRVRMHRPQLQDRFGTLRFRYITVSLNIL